MNNKCDIKLENVDGGYEGCNAKSIGYFKYCEGYLKIKINFCAEHKAGLKNPLKSILETIK